MKETALITGINSFIGGHLKETLEKRDITVVGLPRELLYNVPKLTQFVTEVNPTYIFHLAAYGNHRIQTEELSIIQTNYYATWGLLAATKDIPYKVFINVATSSMYGHTDKPMSEEDPLKPDTFYAASKAGAMYLARAYAKQYNKPVVTAVPFSVFGEGEADWRLIPRICKSLITGEKMSIAPTPTHDWIYVKDFVDALMVLMTSVDRVKGEWVNIGNNILWTNAQVVELLSQISGKELQFTSDYKEPGTHSPYWIGDNKKLRHIGWLRQYSFEEGLKRTWEYYKNKYER